MRVAPSVVPPKADGLQIVADATVPDRPNGPAVRLVGLGQEALADDVADGHTGIERSVRVLEDDLHPAAHLLEGVSLQGQDILAVHRDGAARGLLEPQNRPPKGGLAAAGLPYQAKLLTAVDLQADAVDGVDAPNLVTEHSAHDGEVLLDVGRFDQDLA